MAYEPENSASGTEELVELRSSAKRKVIRGEVKMLEDRWRVDPGDRAWIVIGLVDGLPADTRRATLDILNDKYPAGND